MSDKFRCFGDHLPTYADYHDHEWGRPAHYDRKMGFKFVGPTIIYSFMQAVGMVNDHLKPCFVYKEVSVNGLLG